MSDVLEDLKAKLIIEWDAADEKTKAKVKADYNSLPNFKEVGPKAHLEALDDFYARHTVTDRELMYKSSKDIHDANVKAADKIINNLVQRVEKKIGKITSAANVYTNYDNEGFVILNGYFTGENGKCEVQSIRAGGWNIQKRHIRVLVK